MDRIEVVDFHQELDLGGIKARRAGVAQHGVPAGAFASGHVQIS
jgi:hypothetical protein